MKQKFINAVSMIALAIVMLCAVFAISRANASEKEPDHQTINNISHDHSDLGKGVILGIILACRLNAVRAALFEGRWWTWCGEDRKTEPLPDPGPAV